MKKPTTTKKVRKGNHKSTTIWVVLNNRGEIKYDGMYPMIFAQPMKPNVIPQCPCDTCSLNVVPCTITYQLPAPKITEERSGACQDGSHSTCAYKPCKCICHSSPIERIVEQFEKKFGGFIATQGKREKQDEDNEWLRTKLTTFQAQIENRVLDEILAGLQRMLIKKPNCDCREYSMGAHNCDFTSNDAIRDAISLLSSKKNQLSE